MGWALGVKGVVSPAARFWDGRSQRSSRKFTAHQLAQAQDPLKKSIRSQALSYSFKKVVHF